MKIKTGKVFTLNRHAGKNYLVGVEVMIRRGIPHTEISGLASRGIKESISRIRSSLEVSGWKYPLANISINLSPHDIPKSGNQFDLPIAVAILKAMGELPISTDFFPIVMGELDLVGNILPIPNLLELFDSFVPISHSIFLPSENKKEGIFLFQRSIGYWSSLRELTQESFWIPETNPSWEYASNAVPPSNTSKYPKPSSITKIHLYLEQVAVFNSLVISLVGRHHMLITGVPGSGKTLMGELASELQPPPLPEEISLVLKNESHVSGENTYMERPFRSPHHSLTSASMIGGGNELYTGELGKANKGIIFLDELGEIPSKIIQQMREPLEKKAYTISRGPNSYSIDADFQLIATSNLCPCGQYSGVDSPCICKKEQVKSYLGKLSGPILDRIPIIVELKKVPGSKPQSEPILLETIKSKIRDTVSNQTKRNKSLTGSLVTYNSELKEGMWEILGWNKSDIKIWESFTQSHNIGIRQKNSLLGVARSIADWIGEDSVKESHLYSALAMKEGSKSILCIAA